MIFGNFLIELIHTLIFTITKSTHNKFPLKIIKNI